VEAVEHLRKQFQDVELERVRHAEKVRESENEEEVSLPQVLPVDGRPVGDEVHSFVDVPGPSKAPVACSRTSCDWLLG